MSDQLWASLAEKEQQITELKEHGIRTESDIPLLELCLTTVLGEIKWRRYKR